MSIANASLGRRKNPPDLCALHNLPTCSAGALEGVNAQRLYKRAQDLDYPFRYKTLVGDLDAKVHKKIEFFYGEQDPVLKEHCINHYAKSVCKALKKTFEKAPEVRLKVASSGKKNPQASDYYVKHPLSSSADILSHRFSNLIVHTIRTLKGSDDPLNTICDAIKAIPYHYMDGPELDYAKREELHSRCNHLWCSYVQCSVEDRKEFVPKNKKGQVVESTFTQIDSVQEAIIEAFEAQANKDKISKCFRDLNQNLNESVHARLFRITSKAKKYKISRYRFAAQRVAIENNFGKLCASLLPAIGEISSAEIKEITKLDAKMEYSSKLVIGPL